MQYIPSLKNTRMQDVVTAIDAGGSNGYIEICSNTNVVLLTAPLNRPCGVVANGVLTFSSNLNQFNGVANGVAATARIRTSAAANVVIDLSVGTANSNIIMPVLSITTDMLFVVQSAQITHS